MSTVSSTKVHFGWAGAALLVAAVGCGGSTDSPSSTAGSGGSGGEGASGGTGGAGTSGGSGGSGGSTGGTGGAGGAAGGEPDGGGGDVVCGGTVCPPTTFGATVIPACCTAQNTCGISFGGQAGMCFNPSIFDAGPRPEAGSGVPDPTCASLMVVGITLGGCCMTDNTCGFTSQLGGCVSIETLRGLNLPGVNLPEGGPMSCVYPPP